MIVLDASGSVGSSNFQKMKDFVKDFLSDADIDGGSVRVGVNMFSTGVEVEFDLNSYTTKAQVFDAVDAIPYIKGWTNTASGIENMKSKMFTTAKGDRSDVDNVAIVITDGQSNVDSKRTIPNADAARNEGIYVYAVGIGLANTEELEGIANKPAQENTFAVDDFNALKGLEEEVFAAVCGK